MIWIEASSTIVVLQLEDLESLACITSSTAIIKVVKTWWCYLQYKKCSTVASNIKENSQSTCCMSSFLRCLGLLCIEQDEYENQFSRFSESNWYNLPLWHLLRTIKCYLIFWCKLPMKCNWTLNDSTGAIMVFQGWCKLTPNARLNRWRRFPVSRKAAKGDAEQLWWQLRHCGRPGPGRRRKRFQQKRNILQRRAGPSNHGSRPLQCQRSGRPWWAQLLYVARLPTSSPCLRRVPFHPFALSLQQLSLQQGITWNPNPFSTSPLPTHVYSGSDRIWNC